MATLTKLRVHECWAVADQQLRDKIAEVQIAITDLEHVKNGLRRGTASRGSMAKRVESVRNAAYELFDTQIASLREELSRREANLERMREATARKMESENFRNLKRS